MTAPATVPVAITVTASDIAAGIPGSSCACPIWWALHRLWPELPLEVQNEAVTIVADDDRGEATSVFFADLPPAAVEFIGRYDTGDAVWPFTFTITVPAQWAPAGGAR